MRKQDLPILQKIAEEFILSKSKMSIVGIAEKEYIGGVAKAKYYAEILIDLGLVKPITDSVRKDKLREIEYKYNLEAFIKEHSFEEYYIRKKEEEDYKKKNIELEQRVKELDEKNLILQNENLEYEKGRRSHKEELSRLQMFNLVMQKYWVFISLITGFVGWFIEWLICKY